MHSSVNAALLILIAAPTVADSALYTVTPDGFGDFPTIQAAIDASVDGDIIELKNGIFRGPGNRNLDYGGRAITLRSQSLNPEFCTIDCEGSAQNPRRGAQFISGEGLEAVFEGITVLGGWTDPNLIEDAGGAILIMDSSPTIRNCIFRFGTAGWGGGVRCFGASPRIDRCVFRDNYARVNGPGLYCHRDSAPIVTHCVFFSNSTPGKGGAIVANLSNPEISNCTMVGNHVSHDGSAIWTLNDALPVFRNCIAAFNTGPNNAIVCDNGSIELYCCDIYGNDGLDWPGCVASQQAINGNFSLDPLFCDWPERNFRLVTESPCNPPNHPEAPWACDVIGAESIGCSVAGAPENTPTGGSRLELLGANPTSLPLRYTIRNRGEATTVRLNLVDVSGRSVGMVWDGVCREGLQQVSWSGFPHTQSGVYYLQLTDGGRLAESRKILIFQ